MPRKASTHRLEPAVQSALDRLSKHLRRPKNRLINDAVKFYIQHKSPDVERDLEETLSALRAYRLRGSNFERSIESEARLPGADTADAEPHVGKDQPRTLKD